MTRSRNDATDHPGMWLLLTIGSMLATLKRFCEFYLDCL